MTGRQPAPAHTASGREIWYLDPSRTEVVPEDLRTHLARQCRYAGAVGWSVLEHTALVVELARRAGCTPLEVAYCAAHDLHEAYTPDIPWALKLVVPGYDQVEHLWAEHVHRSVGLAWPVPEAIQRIVRRYDLRSIVVEVHLGGTSEKLRADAIENLGGPPGAHEIEAGRWCQVQAPALWTRVWLAVQAGRATSP